MGCTVTRACPVCGNLFGTRATKQGGKHTRRIARHYHQGERCPGSGVLSHHPQGPPRASVDAVLRALRYAAVHLPEFSPPVRLLSAELERVRDAALAGRLVCACWCGCGMTVYHAHKQTRVCTGCRNEQHRPAAILPRAGWTPPTESSTASNREEASA